MITSFRTVLGDRFIKGIKKYLNQHVTDYHGDSQSSNFKIITVAYEYDFDVHGGAVGEINLGTLNVPTNAPLILKQFTINYLSDVTGGIPSTFDLGITGITDYFTQDHSVPISAGVESSQTTSDLPLSDGDILFTIKNEPLTAGKFQLILSYYDITI